jgi:hypothetical protein
MEALEKLFGGAVRVRLIRLFLTNPEVSFDAPVAARRAGTTALTAGRELAQLEKIGLVNRRPKVKSWQLNPDFPYILPLRVMFKSDVLSRPREFIRQFNGCGRVALIVVAGTFLEESDSRVDLLVVGSGLKKAALDKVVKSLEADLGRELAYASLDTADFQYRLSASDKFVRDVLDYPHHVVLDKLGLAEVTYPQLPPV